MRKSEQVFGYMRKMRRENYAARVPGPAIGVQRGIIFRQIGIAGIAKNAFDKIKICHQSPGNEKAGFHPLLCRKTGNLSLIHI